MRQTRDFTKYIIEQVLGDEAKKDVAVLAGSFRPPTKADYSLLLKALDANPGLDEIHVFVGDAESEGLNQDDAVEIWKMYGEHFPRDFYVHKSEESPVSDVYAYANDNPHKNISWLFGAREGSDEDFKEISDRTKSVNKYPNIQISPVLYDASVTEREVAAAANMGSEELEKYLPSNLTYKEIDSIHKMLTTKEVEDTKPTDDEDNLNESELKKGIAVEKEHTDDEAVAKKIAQDHLEEDPEYYTKLATLGLEENHQSGTEFDIYEQIMDFMSQNGMKLDPRPTINVIDNDRENAEQFFGKTAYYDPANNIVVLYTLGRHPKDVARSFAHELVHCHQNHEGRLEGITTTNTNEDDHLEQIEKEAYETGNIMFRKWSDSVKGGAIQESVKDNKIICDNCGWNWEIEDGGEDMFTCHKCGSEDNQPIVNEKKEIGKEEFAHELSMLREDKTL